MRIYRGRIINPVSPDKFEEFKDGALAVDDNGKIAACGDFDSISRGRALSPPNKGDYRGLPLKKVAIAPSNYRTVELIIPGLIDCHLHLPQLDHRGKHGATLLDWLERYIFPAEKAFSDVKVADDIGRRFFKKLILNGTTTAAVYTTIHARSTDRIFRLAKACGIRAIIGKVMMDQHSPEGLQEETHRSLKESEELCARWHNAAGGRLKYAFTPRFAPTCSDSLLTEAGRLAEEAGAYIQTHIAETAAENRRVKELFPDYEDYTAVYEENGCLGPRTVLGHAIHLSQNEMRRLAQTKTKIAHCPTSNFFLKSGRMPVELIEEHGLHYGLGTDIGAGTSMSLFTAMRHADYIQPHISVTPAKAFYLATLGGARALSLEHETGSLNLGKYADFNVIDIKGIDPRYKLSELSADEILSILMYRGDGDVIKEAYVAGRKLDVDIWKAK